MPESEEDPLSTSHFDRGRGTEEVTGSARKLADKDKPASKGLFEIGLWGDINRIDQDSLSDIGEDGIYQPGINHPFCAFKIRPWNSRLPSTSHQVCQKPFRGRYLRAITASDPYRRDLAWDATLKAASFYQRKKKPPADRMVTIHPEVLMQKQRVRKPGRLLLFLVDISGSMGGKYMAIAKKASLLLLAHAYVKRDLVGVLAFRDRRAAILVPPTNQAQRVQQIISDLYCGGLTPLAAGLESARHTLWKAQRSNPDLESFLILISDGKANVASGPGYDSLETEIKARARALLRQPRLRILFMDTTEEGKVDYSARWLSSLLSAERFVLSRLLFSGLDPASEIVKALGV